MEGEETPFTRGEEKVAEQRNKEQLARLFPRKRPDSRKRRSRREEPLTFTGTKEAANLK